MCKSCIHFFEITDRRATKCMLNPVIYLVWGIAFAIFVLYLMLKAYYRLKESAMHSANKTFQDDLDALGGMDTLTNLRTSLSFGMDAPLIPNADRKLELDLVEVKKTSSENEKETIISSTPLEVIDAWEKFPNCRTQLFSMMRTLSVCNFNLTPQLSTQVSAFLSIAAVYGIPDGPIATSHIFQTLFLPRIRCRGSIAIKP